MSRIFASLALAILAVAAWCTPAAQAQLVRQPSVLSPQAPTAPVLNPNALRPQLRTPLVTSIQTLNIVNPGIIGASLAGSRAFDIQACVANAKGNPGQVSAMQYSLATPTGAVTGQLQPEATALQPIKQPKFDGLTIDITPTKSIGTPGTCYRAHVELPNCSVPGGEYDLTVTAQQADGGGTLTDKMKVSFEPWASAIAVNAPGGGEVGLPKTITGTAKGSCGVQPAQVRLSTPDGSPSVMATVNGGTFSAPFVFRKSGSVALRAAVVEGGNIASSNMSTTVEVAKTIASFTVTAAPKTLRAGGTAPIAMRVVHAASNTPLADLPLDIFIAPSGPRCRTRTDAQGKASCVTMMPANLNVGGEWQIAADSTETTGFSRDGTKVMVVSADGLITRSVTPDLMTAVMADSQPPYGVLLNSYNPNWSGTGARAPNSAKVYPNPDLKDPTTFDIPTFHVTDDIVFYVDNVMVRISPIELRPAARATLRLFVEGANGRGPAIKGFCFDWTCRLIGFDNMVPDVTGIAIKNGALSVDFAVVDGTVVVSLVDTDATFEFECGGIAGPVCAALKSYVNDTLRAQLKSAPVVQAVVKRVGNNVDAALKKQLPAWKIKALTELSFGEDGSMTVAGTPLVD